MKKKEKTKQEKKDRSPNLKMGRKDDDDDQKATKCWNKNQIHNLDNEIYILKNN